MPAVPPSFSPQKLPSKRENYPYLKIVILCICLILTIICGTLFLKNRTTQLPKHKHFIHLKGRYPDFVGRQKYLDLLYKDLLSGDSPKKAFSPVKVKVLWGKGGFGKSELAIEFANLNFSKFSFVWTFLCDSEENIDQGYWQLAEKLGILNPQDPSEKIREKVHLYLENYPSPLPWLLIYDNMERELLNYPQRGGAILITSQKKLLHPEFLLEVTPFSKEEAIELVEKITHEKSGEAMGLLVRDLEGIPLLINYAAHYITATPGCCVAEYQKLFSSYLLEKEGPLWKEGDVNRRYSKSLALSWKLPLKSLEKENPYALEWLFLCSHLHSEYIREEWVESWLAERITSLTGEESLPFKGGVLQKIQEKRSLHIEKNELLKALQNYGMIRYEEKTRTFSVHRFLQHMIRESRANHLNDDLYQVVALLVSHIRDSSFENPSSWEQGKWWYLHAAQVRKWLKLHPFLSSRQNSQLLEGNFYEGIGGWCIYNYHLLEALESYYKALELKSLETINQKIEIGKIYERISSVLFELARYEEALDACNQALQTQIASPKESPLNYVMPLNTKGAIFIEQGKFEEALKCHNEALELCLANLGNAHIQTGRSMFFVAIALRKLGRFQEALDLHERAGSIYQKTCGENHPWFFSNLQNKAWVFFDQGDYKEALKFFQQALLIHISTRGKKPQDLTYSLNGIGWCNLRLGKYTEARKTFKQALQNGKAHYGINNRHVLRAYKGLGWSYIKAGKTKKGFKCLLKQLKIGLIVYGKTPRMVSILEDFKKALQEASKYRGVIEEIKLAAITAYRMSEELFGKDHSLTSSFENFFLQKEKNK